jgi:hypothetical protein
MLSTITLNKIIHESNHGGVQGNHPELTFSERKYLINYLLKGGKCLDTCHLCEK